MKLSSFVLSSPNCYVAVTALTSVSAKMRPGFERRGMSAFKGVVASTDHFDSSRANTRLSCDSASRS
jgi:hypothetical protein